MAVWLILGLPWLAPGASGWAAEAPRPNILFILVDDLGYGDVGAFHQKLRAQAADRSRPWHRTPALDQLAAEGMQLPHHYCPAPVCAPSRASLLLGVHQGHANVRDNQFDKALENNHTLPSVLKQAGYRTIAIGKYGLQGGQETEAIESPNWPAHPNLRGFDDFFGYIRHRDGHEHYPKEGVHRGSKEVWENRSEVSQQLDKCYTTDLFTARTKHAITTHVGQSPDQPFFIYLAYDTPHAVLSLPTQAYPDGGGSSGGLQWTGEPGRMINTASGTPDSYYHPEYADATWDHDADAATAEVAWPDVQKRYATVVRRIDDGIADLLQLLRDLSIDQNTLIVFTTDNGPSVESYLDEAYEPTFFQGYGPYNGIKRDLWEGGVHVGALARWPARIPAGSTSGDHATTFWDWLPTFAEAAGVAPPARTDGVSLLPLLTGHAAEQAPSTVYVEYFQNGKTPSFDDFDPSHRGRKRNQMQLVRQDRFVGVRYDIGLAEDDFEIYDIVADPRQARDLAAAMPELQREFKQRVLRGRRPEASAKRPYDDAPMPALGEVAAEPGVAWGSVAGTFAWVPQLHRMKLTAGGISDQPADAIRRAQVGSTGDGPQVATIIQGYLEVPAKGLYTLSLTTSGGALLRIHEAVVIDADAGYEPGQPSSGPVRLAAGKHPFRIELVHERSTLTDPSAAPLQLRWSGPTVSEGPVPAAAFFRPKSLTTGPGRRP